MYSLFRNYFKFRDRSAGLESMKGVELDFMAPDTAEEILLAISFLEKNCKTKKDKSSYVKIPAKGIEKSNRDVKILYPEKAKTAYKEMLIFYCGSVVFEFIGKAPENINLLLKMNYSLEREKEWVNACGRLLPKKTVVDAEKAVMKNSAKSEMKIESWEDMHDYFYAEFELYGSR